MTGPFLQLNPKDNVLVARRHAESGISVELPDGLTIALTHAIPLAHKIASRDIARGERILKYGMPIGIATEDIPAGAHVHVHNIRSAYTPTYALQDANGQSTEVSQ